MICFILYFWKTPALLSLTNLLSFESYGISVQQLFGFCTLFTVLKKRKFGSGERNTWTVVAFNFRRILSVFKARCHTRFQRALMHALAFSKKLLWLAQTDVIIMKSQTHAVNARWKCMWQLGFTFIKTKSLREEKEFPDNSKW